MSEFREVKKEEKEEEKLFDPDKTADFKPLNPSDVLNGARESIKEVKKMMAEKMFEKGRAISLGNIGEENKIDQEIKELQGKILEIEERAKNDIKDR